RATSTRASRSRRWRHGTSAGTSSLPGYCALSILRLSWSATARPSAIPPPRSTPPSRARSAVSRRTDSGCSAVDRQQHGEPPGHAYPVAERIDYAPPLDARPRRQSGEQHGIPDPRSKAVSASLCGAEWAVLGSKQPANGDVALLWDRTGTAP